MKKILLILGFCLSVITIQAQSFTAGNLALFVISNSSNNTTGNIIEINTTTAGQSAINTYPINGTTGPNALRFSGSATSSCYMSLSNDGSLLCFTGHNTTTTSGNINTIIPRGVGTLNAAGTFALATTYNGSSGNQARCATSIDNNNWFIGDQGGIYTNLTTTASPSGNVRGTKSFGGIVYVGQQSSSSSSIQVSTISAPSSGTIMGLPGLTNSSTFQDFYMVSSGINGATYDILYVTEATSSTVGVISKYSLVSGTWIFNGNYATTFGGFGITAEVSGPGANLYVSTGNGNIAANSVIKLIDQAGYNAAINISTPSNVILYTAAVGTTVKGLVFAPVTIVPPTPTVNISVNTSTASETGATVVNVIARTSSTLVTTETVNIGVSGAGITVGDYTLSNPVITINAGNDTGFVTFTIVDDAAIEGAETATLTISGPSPGLTLGSPTSANVNITDNDFAPPVINFAAPHQSVNENAGAVNVVLNIASPNSNPCTAIITTSIHSTANGAGVDYAIANDTVTFPALSGASQNLVVNIMDDGLPENAEYVSFKFGGFVNGAAGTTQPFHILYIRDNDNNYPTGTNEVMLQLLTSFSNGAEGTNSSEIVAYDSSSQKLVIANSIGAKLDIVNFTNPSSPGPINSINISALGNINSVAVRDGIIAVALENLAPQNNGKVLFYNMGGTLLSQVDVGAMPDMITFNHLGNKVYTVCEGEPNSSYSNDPEGSIAVVDITGGVAAVTNANVTIIDFHAYNGQESTLRSQGIRIYGNNGIATASQDFEPEYITLSDDDQKAWVTLQENNAMVILDLTNNTITDLVSLGTIDHTNVMNGIDASDVTSNIHIANFPIKGLFLPDAITHMNIGGTNYIFTANEGDAREYSGVNNEQVRINSLTLDAATFPDANILKSNFMLGKLRVTNKLGDPDNDGDFDELYAYGGRGFSVWDENGVLLYNSGNLLETIIANNPSYVSLFNVNNDNSAPVAKDRSDDKGPEIEGVAVANIDGDNILFASAERLGGVFLFNIDNPVSPRYIGYYNNRTFGANGPDRGAEGIIYISASASPNGNDLVILANEVSSTLSIYQVNTCASSSGVNVNYTPNDTICPGESVTFTTPVGGSTNLQWLMNNSDISGETGTSTVINTSGYYSLAVQNMILSCADTTAEIHIVVNSLPNVGADVTDNDFCEGTSVTFNGNGAALYTWTGGVTDNAPTSPSASGTYTVTGTDVNGCSNTDTISITVHNLPTVVANVTDTDICIGNPVTFTGSGAVSYAWNGGVTDGVSFTPSATQTYTVTGTDANTCTNTDTIVVTVNNLPAVGGNVTDNIICSGDDVVFTGIGASSYTWSSGVTNGVSFIPSATATYTVTGTDVNSCSNTTTVSVTVNNLPTVSLNITPGTYCINYSPFILTGGSPAGGNFAGSGVSGGSFDPSTGLGSYIISYTYTDANGCTNMATDNISVIGCTGIDEEPISDAVIYPNPAENYFSIKTSITEIFDLRIIDIHGKIICSIRVSASEMIDISQYAAGTYIVELIYKDQVFRNRLIKK